MNKTFDGGPAFPAYSCDAYGSRVGGGMSLRDWFAGRALANTAICTGQAPEYQLRIWFGDRIGITRQEIAARQAMEQADAMLAEREKAYGN